MSAQSISTIRANIESGETTLTEVVQNHINKTRERNGTLNAVTRLFDEQALQKATEVEEKIKNGRAGALAGTVMGIKEAIVEAGKKATCSSKILHNYESVFDATVIERLKKADAIMLSRTNMDEFAMGSSNETSADGPVRNPVNEDMVPGGSSGGSAAAVKAGLVQAALGSDTGGSIRQPASFCGVVGLRPTYGRVSRYGLIAYASSFDSIGPITNNVEDAARILKVISGQDSFDQTSSSKPVQDYVSGVNEVPKKLKIGVPGEYFGEGLNAEIKERVEETIKRLEANGHEALPIHLPHMKYAVATYYVLATAEASSNLARFDGIRYGYRTDARKVADDIKHEHERIQNLHKNSSSLEEKRMLEASLRKLDTTLIGLYKRSRTEGFGDEVKRRIILGTYVLSSGYYDAYYGKAQKIRRLIQNDFLDAFKSVDVIVSPTTPTTAFPLGAKIDDPLQMYLNDIYTISVNLAGIPGISIPIGNHSNDLPIGIQFMGNFFAENQILNIARETEQLYASVS